MASECQHVWLPTADANYREYCDKCTHIRSVDVEYLRTQIEELRTIIAENNTHQKTWDKLQEIAYDQLQISIKMFDAERSTHEKTKQGLKECEQKLAEAQAKLAQYIDENKMADDAVKALVKKCDEQEEDLVDMRTKLHTTEFDLAEALVRERQAEEKADSADCFVLPVNDGFPGEIDVCSGEDGHSHHYVPTSIYQDALEKLKDAEMVLQTYADERAPISQITRGVEHYYTRVGKIARAYFDRHPGEIK